eukprot:6214437-Pleurochrysis_carterae.AAC.1
MAVHARRLSTSGRRASSGCSGLRRTAADAFFPGHALLQRRHPAFDVYINLFKMHAEPIVFTFALELDEIAREPIQQFICSFGVPVKLTKAASMEEVGKSLSDRDCKVLKTTLQASFLIFWSSSWHRRRPYKQQLIRQQWPPEIAAAAERLPPTPPRESLPAEGDGGL